jgi:hypothetical protein
VKKEKTSEELLNYANNFNVLNPKAQNKINPFYWQNV